MDGSKFRSWLKAQQRNPYFWGAALMLVVGTAYVILQRHYFGNAKAMNTLWFCCRNVVEFLFTIFVLTSLTLAAALFAGAIFVGIIKNVRGKTAVTTDAPKGPDIDAASHSELSAFQTSTNQAAVEAIAAGIIGSFLKNELDEQSLDANNWSVYVREEMYKMFLARCPWMESRGIDVFVALMQVEMRIARQIMIDTLTLSPMYSDVVDNSSA